MEFANNIANLKSLALRVRGGIDSPKTGQTVRLRNTPPDAPHRLARGTPRHPPGLPPPEAAEESKPSHDVSPFAHQRSLDRHYTPICLDWG